MRLKIMLSAALAATMVLSTLAGCSSSGTNKAVAETTAGAATTAAAAQTGEAAKEKDPVTLRFSWWGGDARHEATLQVIEAFEKKYPHISIEGEYSSSDGYNEKKLTEFASGTAPDIFQIDNDFLMEYYNRGVLSKLSELDIDFTEFDADYLALCGSLDTDSIWAVPTGISGTAVIVNKDLADAAGIDMTQQVTWEDYIAMGKQVKAYDPECSLLSATTHTSIQFFIRAWCRQKTGNPILSDDYQLNVTKEQFAECFTMIKSLYDNEVLAPISYKASFSEDTEDPKWTNGQYVASIGFVSSAMPLTQAGPEGTNYVAAQLPIMDGAVNDGWFTDCTNVISIYSKSEHPEEAALFLDYFFNDPEALEILGTVRSVPPTAKGQDIAEKAGKLDTLSKDSAEISLQYKGQPDQGPSTTSEVAAIYTDAFENIAYGNMTPEEAANDIVEKLTDFCETNRP